MQIVTDSSLCYQKLSIVPADSTDIIGRTMSRTSHMSPSLSGVQKPMGQAHNKEAVMRTKKKSKALCNQGKERDKKPTRIKHVCKVCDKECRVPSELKDHMRVHSGERPYMCIICDMLFSRKSSLALHMCIHTGDKPYPCKVCDKCFSQSSDLTKHMRIHTGDKPYQCKVCDKCFTRLSHLTVHMRIHTGDKPYQCKVCEKYFCQSG